MKKEKILKLNDIKVAILIILVSTNLNIQAQSVNKGAACNRNTVDKSLEKLIPKGICIPEGYFIFSIVNNFDFNKDKNADIAIRYGKYPIEVGDLVNYSIFEKVNDTTYLKKIELSNIFPPHIDNLYTASQDTSSVAHFLLKKYPYDAKVVFANDTIKISHLIPDDYGKTYEFVYNKNKDNWYLEKVQYWIGNLDRQYVERMNLSEKLLGQIKLESRIPEKKISIKDFDLAKSKKIAEEESEYFINNYDVFNWSK